jgi:dihydroflavonol-4-reductase
MKIGITGASGHVGANLIRRLSTEDHELRVLQHNHDEAYDAIRMEIVKGALDDQESLDKFCEGQDVIFHLAAKISIGNNSYDSIYSVNVTGTKNLVKASKKAGVKRFIHFSSIDALEHAPLDVELDEKRPLRTNSKVAYESTKAIGEEWVKSQKEDDFEVIVLNPTAIIGPNDFKPSFTGDFMIQIYNRKLPGLIPGGYNWVDVRDVCEAAKNAIYQGQSGESYILSGHYKSAVDFVALVGQVTDRKTKVPVFPIWMAKLSLPFVFILSKISGKDPIFTRQSLEIIQKGNKNISCQKAKKELGYTPRPLAETIKDSINWFKENKYI